MPSALALAVRPRHNATGIIFVECPPVSSRYYSGGEGRARGVRELRVPETQHLLR